MKKKSQALETVVHGVFLLLGLITVGCVLLISVYLIVSGIPAIRQIGLVPFLFGKTWASTAAEPSYGILPFILTSVYGTAGAIVLGVPLGFLTAVYLAKVAPPRLKTVLESAVSLLAGIPSIVYGLWGFYVIRPVIVDLGLSSQGFGILTASVVLAIMVIPYAASLSSEFISMVSRELKEGAYSLGGTRLDVIRRVVFPVAGSGIFASYVLALGRALGETMAVTMLIGNTNLIPTGLTATGNTMASVIANQFGEADGLKLSSLVAIGLLLFIITAVINLIGRLILRKFR